MLLFDPETGRAFYGVDIVKLSFEELLAEGGHFEGDFVFAEDDMKVAVENFTADFIPTDSGLYLDVSFSYSYEVPCARCLEPAKGFGRQKAGIQLIRQSLDNVKEEMELTDDDMGVCWVEEDGIDLHEIVRQEVSFHLPVRVVCGDDCKGLCPLCGENLNTGSCRCKSETDPRWIGLDKLKNN